MDRQLVRPIPPQVYHEQRGSVPLSAGGEGWGEGGSCHKIFPFHHRAPEQTAARQARTRNLTSQHMKATNDTFVGRLFCWMTCMRCLLILALSLFVCACKTPSPQAQWATSVQKSFKNTWQVESAGLSLHQTFVVESRVVVARDGEVVSAAITKPSRHQQVDALVARVLESVKNVPPIPAGVTNAQKTFIIVFKGRLRD